MSTTAMPWPDCDPTLFAALSKMDQPQIMELIDGALNPRLAKSDQQLDAALREQMDKWLVEIIISERPTINGDAEPWKHWLAFALYTLPFFCNLQRQSYSLVADIMLNHGHGLEILMTGNSTKIRAEAKDIWCLPLDYQDVIGTPYISVVTAIQKGKAFNSGKSRGKPAEKNVENWIKHQRTGLAIQIAWYITTNKLIKLSDFLQKRQKVADNYRKVFELYTSFASAMDDAQGRQLSMFIVYSQKYFEEGLKDSWRKETWFWISFACTFVIAILVLIGRAFTLFELLSIILLLLVPITLVIIFISSATACMIAANAACATLDDICRKVVEDSKMVNDLEEI